MRFLSVVAVVVSAVLASAQTTDELKVLFERKVTTTAGSVEVRVIQSSERNGIVRRIAITFKKEPEDQNPYVPRAQEWAILQLYSDVTIDKLRTAMQRVVSASLDTNLRITDESNWVLMYYPIEGSDSVAVALWPTTLDDLMKDLRKVPLSQLASEVRDHHTSVTVSDESAYFGVSKGVVFEMVMPKNDFATVFEALKEAHRKMRGM